MLAQVATYPSRARYVIVDFIGENCSAAVTTDRYAGCACIDAQQRQIGWAHTPFIAAKISSRGRRFLTRPA